MTAKPGKPRPEAAAPEPVDVSDGIPDRSNARSWWKYLALAVAFAGWVAFLVYCLAAGTARR